MSAQGVSESFTSYAQYYQIPLNANPALAGHIQGTQRLGLLYRQLNSQKDSINGVAQDNFSFAAINADANFLSKKIKTGSLGVGLLLKNDRTFSNSISSFQGALSVAYHQRLGKAGKHFLSVGVRNSLSKVFIKGVTKLEINRYNLAAGLVWSTYLREELVSKIGITYTDILVKSETKNNQYELNKKIPFIFHAELQYQVNRLYLHPFIATNYQSNSFGLNSYGLNIGYSVVGNWKIFAGVVSMPEDFSNILSKSQRIGGMFGIGYANYRLQMSYDQPLKKYNTSNFQGLELSFSVFGGGQDKQPIMPALRFH